MKIIDTMWFSGMTAVPTMGIVFIENPCGERKAYIGAGIGVDINDDIASIMNRGSPVTLHHAEIIIKHLKGNK